MATWVWRELQEHQMHLVHRGPDVELNRKQDGFLTQIFLDLGFGGETLERLNWCRMFLHATCLSDLSNAAGTHLRKEAWEGRQESHRPAMKQPRSRARPPTSRWRLSIRRNSIRYWRSMRRSTTFTA